VGSSNYRQFLLLLATSLLLLIIHISTGLYATANYLLDFDGFELKIATFYNSYHVLEGYPKSIFGLTWVIILIDLGALIFVA